ncbi:hypothetical protein ACFX15_013407 [Malus domestica]
MAGGSPKEDLKELGTRFGTNLILSEKEQGGVCIERKDIECALLGFQYTLIAEVLTAKAVKGDVFVDRFMSLCVDVRGSRLGRSEIPRSLCGEKGSATGG